MDTGSPPPLILVVEDDPLLANLYFRLFEKEGYKVLVARDGKEGLRLAETKIPDFILLDNLLPKLNGLELLAQVKLNPKLSHIPVLVLSNLAFEEERERALTLGAVDYLAKAAQAPEVVVEKAKKYLQRP